MARTPVLSFVAVLFVTQLVAATSIPGMAIFGSSDVFIGDGVTVSGGAIGSGPTDVFLGAGTQAGDVFTEGNFVEGGNSTLGRIIANLEATLVGATLVNGNLDVGGTASLDQGVTINGVLTAGTINWNPAPPLTPPTIGGGPPESYTAPPLPALSGLTAGGADVNVDPLAVLTLPPGSYGFADLGAGSTLNLSSGNYAFSSLFASDDVDISIDLSGGPVRVYSQFGGFFGLNTEVSVLDGDPSDVSWESELSWFLDQGTDWIGDILVTGDYESISVYSGSNISGALTAPSVFVDTNSTVTGHGIDPAGPVVIPEPLTVLSVLIGLTGVGSYLRRRRQSGIEE